MNLVISKPSWHKDYKTCPKSNTFFLMIDGSNTASQLEPIRESERIQSLRKYELANGISFPAFNAMPLYHAGTDQAKEALKALKKCCRDSKKGAATDSVDLGRLIDELVSHCSSLWTSKELDRITKCLQGAGLGTRIAKVIPNLPNDLRAIKEVMRRAGACNADALMHALDQLVRDEIVNRPHESDQWIETVLISSASKPKSAKRFSLVIELADHSSFPYPANHPKVQAWVNNALLGESLPQQATLATTQRDAFGQAIRAMDFDVKFPAVNLPILGKVILRAMNKESPCQRR
jgi:hypothetical protein